MSGCSLSLPWISGITGCLLRVRALEVDGRGQAGRGSGRGREPVAAFVLSPLYYRRESFVNSFFIFFLKLFFLLTFPFCFCNMRPMSGNEFLQKKVSELGLTVNDVARLTGLSQGLVSMHLTRDGKNRRGIGAAAAWAYYQKLDLPLDKLLQRPDKDARAGDVSHLV